MKVVAATPSRGLIHSRTVEAVLRESWSIGDDWVGWLFTHDLPIPDCFNELVERALATCASAIWLVEEDMQPGPGTLVKMVDALYTPADIAVVDYPVGLPKNISGKTYPTVTRDGAGRVTWCGTGCILIQRHVFDSVPRPWFTLQNRLVKPGVVTWQGGEPSKYGSDIAFTFACHQLGFKFAVVDAQVNHLRVVERGQSGKNCGFHIIEPLPPPIVEHRERLDPRRK